MPSSRRKLSDVTGRDTPGPDAYIAKTKTTPLIFILYNADLFDLGMNNYL